MTYTPPDYDIPVKNHSILASKNGQIVSVKDVPSGLACGYHCLKCNESLIAKKGHVYRHHFSHRSSSVCTGSYETESHLYAKQLLKEKMFLIVPYPWTNEALRIDFESIELEKKIGNIRPDVYIRIKGQDRPLVIEITATHGISGISHPRVKAISDLGMGLLEIDISYVDDYNSIQNNFPMDFIYSLKGKRWLSPAPDQGAPEFLPRPRPRSQAVDSRLGLSGISPRSKSIPRPHSFSPRLSQHDNNSSFSVPVVSNYDFVINYFHVEKLHLKPIDFVMNYFHGEKVT